MATQMFDSSNPEHILAAAGVEPEEVEAEEKGAAGTEASAHDEGDDSGDEGANHEDGSEDGDEPNPDEEDENGLTSAQREELTAKMQKAIGKKHRALREAEEFAAAQYNTAQLAQRRAEQLEAELAKLQGQKPADEDAPKALTKPDPKDFSSDADYIDAMIQYGVDQRLAEERERQAKENAERQQQEILSAAAQRLDKARELVPDFDEVVGDVDTEVPPAVGAYMQRSEMLAELGYHFAKNPDILVSLSKLPPDEQLVKLGRIEGSLKPFGEKSETSNATTASQKQSNGAQASSETTGKVPSKTRGETAPIIKPLDSAGGTGHQKDSADMNIRETIEAWAKQNGTNLKRRQRH